MARQFVFSLRARMITLILLISLPTLGLIIYNDLQHRNRLAREAKNDALHLTRLVAKEYNKRQSEARMISSLMLEIPRLRNAEPESCKEVFSRMLGQYDQFTSLNICSADGKILCSVPSAPTGTSFADRPYFRQALESGGFASSGFITGRVTGKSLVAFALPAAEEEERGERVIVGGLNTSWLNEMLEEPSLPEGSIFKIIDSEGTIRLRIPDPGQWVGRSAPDWPLLDELKEAGREGVVEAPDLHDRPRVHAFTVLDETQGPDIYFSTGIPSEIVFAEAERSLRRNVLIVALLTAFILLAAWIGADLFLIRQVRALRETTDRLKRGDLGARANLPGRRSEIGYLGESFDGMAAELQKRAEEAEEHQARIARLNRVYSVLSGINGAIIRLRDQEELLEEVCKIAVYKGGFQMASVGLLDPERGKIRIMSREGSGESFMEHQDIPVAETSIANRNTIAEALKKLEPFISNDIDADQRLGPWREKALECGFRSFGAFPLVIGNELFGTLNLYADIRHFFDDQEIDLLTELAADTALGLENIEKESHINYLAYYDTLTDLPNRTLLNDRLEQSLKRGSAIDRLVAVAVFKIMRFREVNQLLGYRVGDKLLRATASYLSDMVRQGDTVARTGGSEFAIVLSDVADADDIPTVAEKLLRNFESLPIIRNDDIFVTARLGLSVFPGDGKDPATLFKNAQAAVHTPQLKSGSSFQFFSENLQTQALARHKMEKALNRAIERQELHIHYQPVVNVATGSIFGAEALCRWENDELGRIGPDVFIPLAEETGLIIPIGTWVLNEACHQAAEWENKGHPPLLVAVNVAVKQIRQDDFIDKIRNILASSEIGSSHISLAIELTESGLMEDVARDIEKFHALQGLGLQIYVDDFGTGYSSLSYLKRLPVNKLKIDRSFINGITTSDEDVAIASAIIALAHSLGLEVIAEGVETEEQLRLLHSLDCDYYQGYLFSPAVSAEDFEELLESKS